MNRKLTPRQQRIREENRKKEIKHRFYHRNFKAQSFCNKHGLVIYASSQANNSTMVKLFVQKGVPFKPLNDVLYDQEDPNDVMAYVAAIDAEYERLYLKMKDKV